MVVLRVEVLMVAWVVARAAVGARAATVAMVVVMVVAEMEKKVQDHTSVSFAHTMQKYSIAILLDLVNNTTMSYILILRLRMYFQNQLHIRK